MPAASRVRATSSGTVVILGWWVGLRSSEARDGYGYGFTATGAGGAAVGGGANVDGGGPRAVGGAVGGDGDAVCHVVGWSVWWWYGLVRMG